MTAARLERMMPAGELLEHMVDMAMRDSEAQPVVLMKPKDS